MLFSYPVTQFFSDCYTICYAADGQLPTTELLVTHHKTDRPPFFDNEQMLPVGAKLTKNQ